MGRLPVIFMLGLFAVVAAMGCGGSSTAHAVPPTVFDAGVRKDIWVNYLNGGGFGMFNDTTTAVTVNGNIVSFEDNTSGVPRQVVFIGYPVQIREK
jgi:hypothetical protein